MNRKLKALGLALVAMFAFGAFAASGAQAETHKTLKLTAGEYPASLTGEQIEGAGHVDHIFEPELGKITCKKAKFAGTIASAEANTVITITPTYTECSMTIGGSSFSATVNMTKCDYLFTEGTATADPDVFNKGQTSLKCEKAEEAVHVTVYESTVHTEANRRCEFTVTQFEHKGENVYTNTTGGTDDIDVTSNVSGIKVHRTFGTLFKCGLAEQTSTYKGTTTLRAYKDDGVHNTQLSLTVSGGV